jgi:hypothetical protein
MKKNPVIGLFVSFLTAGWLIPFWLAVDTYLDFRQSAVLPLALNVQPVSSFPYLHFVATCFGIAMAWLALVVACWAYVAHSVLTRRQAP